VRRVCTLGLRVLIALAAFAAAFTLSSPQRAQACTGPPPPVQRTSSVSKDGSTLRMTETATVRGRDPSRFSLAGAPATAAGAVVGKETVQSFKWTDTGDPDHRKYYYVAEAWIEWTPSVPCTGDDTYRAEMELTCKRDGPGGTGALTPCYFQDEYVALWRGSSNPWKYRKYVRNTASICVSNNATHTASDATYVWAKVIIHLWFYDPFISGSLLHEAQRKATGSDNVSQGAFIGFNQYSGELVNSGPPAAADVTGTPDLC
jgi:hypothetical protein